MSFWYRPTIDELLIVVAGIIIFVIYLAVNGDGDEELIPETAPVETATAATTATPTPEPTPTPAPEPTPTPPPEPAATATPTAAPTATAEPVVANPDECDFGDVADTVRAAIVQVFTDAGSGTAFHIGDGLYVTAAHVIQDDSGRTMTGIWIQAASGQPLAATVEREGSFSRTGTERDLAVLRTQAISAILERRSPTEDDRDIDVRAFGYPWSSVGNTDRSDGSRPLQTSKGVVSAVTVADGIEIIQTDASVDRGMSGGPLVDECGYALAVASFIPTTDDADDPGDFAAFISIAEIENLD